jgi:hypothetical protein
MLNAQFPASITDVQRLPSAPPDAAVDAGVVSVLIAILKDPNDQIAYRAAELLGDFGREPDLAVPALVAGVQGTNVLVASTAARSLGRFGKQASAAVPALLEATRGPPLHAPVVQVFLMRFVIVVPLAHAFISSGKKLFRSAWLDVIVDEGDVKAALVPTRFHLAGFPSLRLSLFRRSGSALGVIEGETEITRTRILEPHDDIPVTDHLAW